MKKKLINLMLLALIFFTFRGVKVFADDEQVILGETIVNVHKNHVDLPKHFHIDKGVPMYTYEIDGEFIETMDFRPYFEILDNRVDILDMHRLDDFGEPIDKGGYEWDFGGFDIEVPGEYDITISYKGVQSEKSATITVEVIEEDITPPQVYFPNFNFNITKTDEEFEREFQRYLGQIRVYDLVDGIIHITVEDFDEDELQELNDARLGDRIELTLVISDSFGNEIISTARMNIVDRKAPNIQNVRTVVAKVNKPVDFKGHLVFVDNYNDPDEIIKSFTVYGTLVQKNVWQASTSRRNDKKGVLIDSYIRMTDDDSFVSYLQSKQPRGYNLGDYYEVHSDEGIRYFYIKEKKEIEGQEVRDNIWVATSSKGKLRGKLLEKYTLFEYSSDDFIQYLEEHHEADYNRHDFFKIKDVLIPSNNDYFVYISEKENEYRDLQEDSNGEGYIDFTKIGVQYVRVTAEDEGGNRATVYYRVVIENSISLMQTVLIVNAVVLVFSAVVVGVIYIRPIILKKRNEE